MLQTDYYKSTLTVDRLITEHHAPEMCLEACRHCENYGTVWACPPFGFNPLDRIRPYSFATIFATKVQIPPDTELIKLPIVLRELRKHAREKMLAIEEANQGLVCILAGQCDYCYPEKCTRSEGKACRYKEYIRPSLEAFGFNLESIIRDLFGLRFTWSTDNIAPPYLILVTALFHNNAEPVGLHRD